MKAPPPATRILGHPILSGLLMLAGMGFIALCLFHGTQGALPAIIVGVLLNRVMKAQEAERDYRGWKRAWDAMDPAGPAPRRPWMLMARTVTVIGVVLYGLTHLTDMQVQVALAFMIVALLLWLAVTLRRRFGQSSWRSPRARPADAVTIALRAPLLPVPSLPQAYAALPDYCQRLIRQR